MRTAVGRLCPTSGVAAAAGRQDHPNASFVPLSFGFRCEKRSPLQLVSGVHWQVPAQASRTGLKPVPGTEPYWLRGHIASDSVACLASSSAAGVDPSLESKTTDTDGKVSAWDIRLLYDSDCPLCMREVAMLMSRDGDNGKIDFVDIAAPSYNPDENQGISYETAMERIHGILPDGTVVTNIEVFRRCYEAVGLGWLYTITKYYPFGPIANTAYEVWAKYRLKVTGRPDLAVLLEKRKSAGAGVTCTSEDSCEIPFPPSKK